MREDKIECYFTSLTSYNKKLYYIYDFSSLRVKRETLINKIVVGAYDDDTVQKYVVYLHPEIHVDQESFFLG